MYYNELNGAAREARSQNTLQVKQQTMKKAPRGSIPFRPVLLLVAVVIALGTGISVVQATLLAGPSIIPAPASVIDDPPGAVNERQQAFDEAQEVTLTRDIRCDRRILPEGTTVNSHMIFYNTRVEGISTDANRTWTFENEIICVMSNGNGLYQAVSTDLLGAPGTEYPGPFDNRGLEGDDSYTVNGNEIIVTMNAEEPGDWIRVVTAWTPEEDTVPPVVSCVPQIKNEKNRGAGVNDKQFELIGADETDGLVDLYLIDSESGYEFGPYTDGTMITHTVAKGATPSERVVKKDAVDVAIKSQGELLISATDDAENTAEVNCTS